MAEELIQLQPAARDKEIVVDIGEVVDALQRAYAYVDEAGSELDRLRFAVLLEKESPENLLEALAARQSSNGFFAVLSQNADEIEADVATSLEALTVLDDHGLLDHPKVKSWVKAVTDAQKPDGMWGDDEGVFSATRLAQCGMLGGFLVKSNSARVVVVDRALEAMADQWSSERVGADTYPLLAAYFHLFTFATHDLGDEALQWCGRELEKGARGGVISALEAVRIFLFCDAYALPGLSMDGGRLIPELLREQESDGSFPAKENELGLQTPVQATLTAVLALSRFSRELQSSLPASLSASLSD